MYQELLEKLHTALYASIPLAEDREQLIAEIGETIWLESLDMMLDALPKQDQEEAVTHLNSGNLDTVIEIFERNNIDVDAIITSVSNSVMDEVMVTAQAA
jgi:hypothetical protein